MFENLDTVGHFDKIENGYALGWAMIKNNSLLKLPINIVLNGEVVASGIADKTRDDLSCAFKIFIPTSIKEGSVLKAIVANIDQQLTGECIFEEEKVLKKIILKSGLFDVRFYRDNYADVRTSRMLAIDHFCKIGIQEEKKPNKNFDPVWYKEHYPDIKKAGVHAIIHFILYGKNENRFQNEAEKR